MCEYVSRAVAKVVLPLSLAIVALVVAFSLPVYADVSFSFTARVVDENRSQVRVLTISKDTDTVSFGEEEGVPLGELKEEAATEADKAKAKADAEKDIETVRKIKRLESGPRVEIEKRRPGSINIQIGDEYYEEGKDIVKFGESVEIKPDEIVEGDIVIIGGSLTVYGTVKGDAVCLGGTLTAGSTGVIEGDAIGIGGTVVEEPGSSIKGDVVSMGDFVPGWVFKGPWPMYGARYGVKAVGVMLLFIKMLIVLFIAWLVAAVASERVKRTADAASARPLASFGLGLLVLLLTPIAIVLLCITIIGIPVAIMLPVALIVVGFFGYTAVGLALGRKLFGRTAGSVVKAAVIGVLLLEAVAFIGKVVCLPWGPLCIIAIPIRIVGWAIIACAISMGIGSTILSKMGQAPKVAPVAWVRPGPPGTPPVPVETPPGGPGVPSGPASPTGPSRPV